MKGLSPAWRSTSDVVGIALASKHAKYLKMFLDMQGNIVHRWALPYRPGAYGYLLDNRRLLVAGRTGKGPVAFGGTGGTLLELEWDGAVFWEHVEDPMHYDFCRMSNGNTMILGWEPVPADMVPPLYGETL